MLTLAARMVPPGARSTACPFAFSPRLTDTTAPAEGASNVSSSHPKAARPKSMKTCPAASCVIERGAVGVWATGGAAVLYDPTVAPMVNACAADHGLALSPESQVWTFQ